ncbi:MAG: hypothetical protein ACI4HI_00930 [Lachnospiraceae bacterium]
MREKSMLGKFFCLISKIVLMLGVILAFYKLPSIVAEKISYKRLQKKTING